jgi:hypothetical protein
MNAYFAGLALLRQVRAVIKCVYNLPRTAANATKITDIGIFLYEFEVFLRPQQGTHTRNTTAPLDELFV